LDVDEDEDEDADGVAEEEQGQMSKGNEDNNMGSEAFMDIWRASMQFP